MNIKIDFYLGFVAPTVINIQNFSPDGTNQKEKKTKIVKLKTPQETSARRKLRAIKPVGIFLA